MTIRVWDPLIRVFHWGLVAAFAIAWLTADEAQEWHEWAGYAAAALIGIRLVWGLVGTRYARFAQFVRAPAAALRYARDAVRGREHRYIGHNPAGGVMVVALLGTMFATAFTGWLLEDPSRLTLQAEARRLVSIDHADDRRAHAGERGTGGDDALEEVHEVLANLMLVLVGLHVGGVALASLRHRENLVRSMITGRKRAPEPGDIA